MPSNVTCVLVADVVESSALPDLRAVLRAKIRIANISHLEEKRIRLPYAVTAGDEFQTITQKLSEVPALILDLRRRLRPLELRIGIGIGDISGPVRPPVNSLGGQAFQFARHAIESIKGRTSHKYDVLTAFRSANEQFDLVANLVYGLHDTLLLGISEKQWDAIVAYMPRNRVDLTAKALKVNVSTASRLLKRGYYWQIADTVEKMSKIIEYSFS
jgi:hypothetical protein